jgi:hypothetical protein
LHFWTGFDCLTLTLHDTCTAGSALFFFGQHRVVFSITCPASLWANFHAIAAADTLGTIIGEFPQTVKEFGANRSGEGDIADGADAQFR